MRIEFNTMRAEFERVLLKLGFATDKAAATAGIFAANSLDGVYTHGLNRFPVFVQYVKEGLVKLDVLAAKVDAMGAIERWDGQQGIGVLNATAAMDRAMKLASQYGIGCVAMRNTNHWMRGGTYGWQAADAGFISICFTNAISSMAPWGGTAPHLGNNPLVIAVPRAQGNVVLDMALSQYSFGKLLQYNTDNEELPLPGGYDTAGNLSTDAAAIISSRRLLPIGFWKGSGLSVMLDMLAAVLSSGRSVADIDGSEKEYGVSQVFIAIKPGDDRLYGQLTEQIINYTKAAGNEDKVRYPGEGTLKTRQRNQKEGIPVDVNIWERVKLM